MFAFVLALGSHDHHDVFQRLSGQRRHCSLFLGIANREQQEQLLVCWALEQHPELGAAVEGCGGHCVQTRILQQDRQQQSETEVCALCFYLLFPPDLYTLSY